MKCGQERPLTAFGRNKNGTLRRPCKPCQKENNRVWRAADLERLRAQSREYYAANRDRAKVVHAKWRAANRDRIKIVNSAWARANLARRAAAATSRRERRKKHGPGAVLFEAQRGLCGICSVDLRACPPRHVHLDHCHRTGRLRGWLCHGCNTGIGLLADDPARMRAAANYVEGSNGTV